MKQQYFNKPGRFFLDDWQYSLDNTNFFPITIDQLDAVYKLVPAHKGYVTLKTTFEIPSDYPYLDVGINIGSIFLASKIFINGEMLCSVGSFPPKPFHAGKQSHCVKIPNDVVTSGKPIELEIALLVDGIGGIAGVPLVAPYKDASAITGYQTFFLTKLNLAFAIFAFFAMFCFFSMYLKNKREKEYFSFALLNVCTALYLFPYYFNEIPGIVGYIGMLNFTKLYDGMFALMTCYFDVSFVRDLLKHEESKKVFVIRLVTLFLPCIFVACIPSLVLYYKLKPLIITFAIMQMIFAFKPIAHAIKIDLDSIKEMAIGFAPVLITIIVDLFVKGVLKYNMLPYFTIYGWQITILSFLVIVATRYAKFRTQAEYLNSKLEKEVEERTLDLTKANKELEERNNQADRDMALAVQVQKSFYPRDTDFLGWDIALSFEPFYGVSGDLYDFYVLEGRLRGFGVFDVSGHGISSGLVTMLAKNAIFHSFRTTIPLSFDEAVKRINDSVIRTKGNIQNYLVGCLCRIDREDSSKLELVNAGGPYPVYKSVNKNDTKLIVPNKDKPQYGMLGIEGIDVQFQTINLTMNEGDVLVLYTDGITESENTDGEQYGNERLRSAIERASGSAQEILDYLMDDFSKFVGTTLIDDDITVVILKKTEEISTVDDLDEIGVLDEVFDEEEDQLPVDSND